MECCCDNDPSRSDSRETVVSASLALLEEKYRRAMSFGEYLEQHPDSENPLMAELLRQVGMYRIALHNLIREKRTSGEK
jgi:hypothetical protein